MRLHGSIKHSIMVTCHEFHCCHCQSSSNAAVVVINVSSSLPTFTYPCHLLNVLGEILALLDRPVVKWKSVILASQRQKPDLFVCLKMGEAKGPGEKDVHKKGLSSNSATAKVDEPGFMVLQAGVLPFLRFYWL